MKATLQFLLGLFCIIILGCNDDETTKTLPDATQTGRGIFACYVDGKPFIDNSGSPNGISFNCFYQNISGEYHFGIQGNGNVKNIISVGLSSSNLNFVENQTYQLFSDISGDLTGKCDFYIAPDSQELSLTNENYTGELIITKFDIQNQIISGTFWFDIQNPFTGDRVKITQGRFDTHFGL